jgi:hypothetical protein|tara:strand:- start:326 stop:640 length:315 start_codon:yes stop_codon:yes gene_type:complete
MGSSDIVRAIKAINNKAEIVVYGPDLDTCTIEWRVGPEISKADIKTKMDELATINTRNQKRILGYGSIGDQLDLLYKDMLAGKGDSTGEWFKKIKAVKDDNPKE